MLTLRWLGVGVLVLGGAVVVAAATVPPNRTRDYAIVGLDSVMLRSNVTVTGGSVGVNGPTGAATLMRKVRVADAVAANTINLGPKSQAGALYCLGLVPAEVTTATCAPTASPLLGAVNFPIVQANPGTQRIRVEPLATLGPLPAGAYGAVRVGDKARLELDGGEYDFSSVWVGYRSQLVCRSECTIRVARDAVVRIGALIGAAAASDAGDVRLEIRGLRAGPGAAFRAYKRSIVNAQVYAPEGAIVLGINGDYTGSFTARTIFVYQKARITGLDATVAPTP